MKFLVLMIVMAVHSLDITQSFAQTAKVPLSVDDARLWRSHSTTLSDDGQWYTNHYQLIDEPENEKDSVLQKLADQTSQMYYTDDNKTDVLYIHHVKDGLKYKITDGSDPVFSNDSKWVAFKVVMEIENKKEDDQKKDTTHIVLKHLATNFTVRYEGETSYCFPEKKNYLISAGEHDLLIYDLANRREHFIGQIGEYLVDRNTNFIAYTIHTEDGRGNGLYLYNPQDGVTQTLSAGNYVYSNLAWDHEKNAIAAYKIAKRKNKDDQVDMLVMENVTSGKPTTTEYAANEITGIPKDKGLAASPGIKQNGIIWSKDGQRLFVRLKEVEADENHEKANEDATVQVWHWKDKKLLSERIVDAETDKDKTYQAIFFRETKKVVPLTGEEIQNLIYSEGTDRWAIGTDNRKYLSDWDVSKQDLYRINLQTGERKLLETGYRSQDGNQIQWSPDGTKVILWDEKDYWFYDIANDTRKNITENLPVSFVDTEYDRWGWVPSYGFVGWVKDLNAVIVNHQYDLWLIPIDSSAEAQNLTKSARGNDPIRFRWEDQQTLNKAEPNERYLDLSKPQLLTAFNTETKYSGFYRLEKNKVTRLIFEPASFKTGRSPVQIVQSKNSDALLFNKGDVQHCFESYLSDRDFSKPRKISNTNPQQEKYYWGKSVLIDYTNDDGVPLQATLTIPEDHQEGEKLPMIVYSYEKMSDLRYSYRSPRLGSTAPTMLYVSNGYLFLEPDIHFNIGTPHSDMHESINAAIEKVIELGYVDEDRIGYNGFSFGGHTGMYVATQENKFAAISAGAGVSNLVQGFTVDIVWDGGNEQDYYMTSQGRLGEDPTTNTQMYIRESAIFHAQTMDTPLLLYHGTADQVVQWEHSFGYYNLLRYWKKPVVFLSYRGEGHGLKKEANRLDFQRRLKAYFDHYLKGEEARPWMTEELPYMPEKESDDEKEKISLPKWK